MPADPLARLLEVPWEALRGLGPVACDALRPVLKGAPAERALDKLLRAHREFDSAQRAALAEAVFGVALWRRRLAYAAGLAHWEGAEPALLLCSLLHSLGGLGEANARELSGYSTRDRNRDSIDWQPIISTLPLGCRWSLPDWLAHTIERELAVEADAFARAICAPGPICLRANTLRTSRDELAAWLLRDGIKTRPARHAAHALIVEVAAAGRPNLLGAAANAAGLFEVQDEGSQLLGALVDPQPGETVLDACAGAGGKTLLLAAALHNRGRVLATDIDPGRLLRLSARARKAGATSIELATDRVGLVDRILVDAPCSELGALRRGPDARWRLQPESFAHLPALQLRILEDAVGALRPGGRLVYGTCTLRREENEDVARALEAGHPLLTRLTPGADSLDSSFVSDGFFRALPHRHDTDGFFAAVYEMPR